MVLVEMFSRGRMGCMLPETEGSADVLCCAMEYDYMTIHSHIPLMSCAVLFTKKTKRTDETMPGYITLEEQRVVDCGLLVCVVACSEERTKLWKTFCLIALITGAPDKVREVKNKRYC